MSMLKLIMVFCLVGLGSVLFCWLVLLSVLVSVVGVSCHEMLLLSASVSCHGNIYMLVSVMDLHSFRCSAMQWCPLVTLSLF